MKKILISGFIIFSLIFSSGIFSESVYAGCIDNDTGQWTTGDCKDDKKVSNLAKNGINVFIGIIGFLAVVVVIYGGFLMVTSEGDAGKVKKAKDTILYGVVGLIVAMMAFGIVKFVVDNVFKTEVKAEIKTETENKVG